MFEALLVEQNPHWKGEIPETKREREVFSRMVRYLEVPHIVSVVGVRRSGKSTLLWQMIRHLLLEKCVPPQNILFVNLEHPYFSLYTEDVRYLEMVWEEYHKIASPEGQIYVFFDEVQFFRKWPVFVKAHFERDRVKFFLSGSNAFLLSKDLLTLLSGRTLPLEVLPFSFAETAKALLGCDTSDPKTVWAQKLPLQKLVDRYCLYGGFPEIVVLSSLDLANEILSSYAKTILYQDVAARLQLKKGVDLEKLFIYLVSHIGKRFSYANLGELLDLSDKTIKQYIQALSHAYLLFEVTKFSFSLKKQMRAEKKIYAIDLGMIQALSFRFSENRGRVLENGVFLYLLSQGWEIYYYETSSKYEVDFLVKKGEKRALLQVSIELHEKSLQREVRSVLEGAKELRLSKAYIVTLEVERVWEEEGVQMEAVPFYRFALSFSL